MNQTHRISCFTPSGCSNFSVTCYLPLIPRILLLICMILQFTWSWEFLFRLYFESLRICYLYVFSCHYFIQCLPFPLSITVHFVVNSFKVLWFKIDKFFSINPSAKTSVSFVRTDQLILVKLIELKRCYSGC